MRLIATKEFTYAGKPLKVGEQFEASDEDARMLKGFGKARAAGNTPPREATPQQRGRYNRNDMRARN